MLVSFKMRRLEMDCVSGGRSVPSEKEGDSESVGP